MYCFGFLELLRWMIILTSRLLLIQLQTEKQERIPCAAPHTTALTADCWSNKADISVLFPVGLHFVFSTLYMASEEPSFEPSFPGESATYAQHVSGAGTPDDPFVFTDPVTNQRLLWDSASNSWVVCQSPSSDFNLMQLLQPEEQKATNSNNESNDKTNEEQTEVSIVFMDFMSYLFPSDI